MNGSANICDCFALVLFAFWGLDGGGRGGEGAVLHYKQ